jgi:hypothetical protein
MFAASKTLAYVAASLLLASLPAESFAGNPPVAPHAKQHKAKAKGFWNSLSRRWLTGEQVKLLNLAHHIGIEEDGEEHAAMLQAIMMQESHAGNYGRIGDVNADVGKRSYGVMQVKLITAYDVLKNYPEMGSFKTEESLIVKLVTDDAFNIRIASKHLMMLRKHTKRDAQAVMAYNTGLNKAMAHWYPEKFRYVRKVKRYLVHVVAPFNKRFGNEGQIVALLD